MPKPREVWRVYTGQGIPANRRITARHRTRVEHCEFATCVKCIAALTVIGGFQLRESTAMPATGGNRLFSARV